MIIKANKIGTIRQTGKLLTELRMMLEIFLYWGETNPFFNHRP
ncbi:MAG: hypothetical protein P8184_03000 [Calditrichia bacterium]